MKESIFRKESLERISSPGELNQYIRVADSGTWLIMAAIVLLLLGVMVWGIFGTVEDCVPACVVSDEAAAVCYIDAGRADRIEAGMMVRADGEEGVLAGDILAAGDLPEEAQAVIGAAGAYTVQADFESLPQGVYEAEVVVERITPISFVLQ